jgi:hypothetical protein
MSSGAVIYQVLICLACSRVLYLFLKRWKFFKKPFLFWVDFARSIKKFGHAVACEVFKLCLKIGWAISFFVMK